MEAGSELLRLPEADFIDDTSGKPVEIPAPIRFDAWFGKRRQFFGS